MLEHWLHVCRVKITLTLLLTICFFSATTISMKCLVNWIPLRFHVCFRNTQPHLQNKTLQNTALRCNTLQHTVTHCITLNHTATHCNTLQHTADDAPSSCAMALNHTATHCNTLQHTATHCNTLQRTADDAHSSCTMACVAVCCSVLQCVAVWQRRVGSKKYQDFFPEETNKFLNLFEKNPSKNPQECS